MGNTELEFVITAAETNRVNRQLLEAIAVARSHGTASQEELAALSNTPEFVRLMQLWRIWTVSLGSVYKRTRNGQDSLFYLLEMRQVIRNYYNDPVIQQVASDIFEIDRAEYFMYPEMMRDKGAYWTNVSNLTNNIFWLDCALQAYRNAHAASPPESSVHNLSAMQSAIVGRYLGKSVDFIDFQNAYRKVIQEAEQVGNHDRKAVCSWWYTKEALLGNNLNAAHEGFSNLRASADALHIPWIRYPLQEAVGIVLTLSRRATLGRIDQARFSLY